MVVCRRSYRGKSRKGGPQTPLRCAQNAAFCKPFASAAAAVPIGGAKPARLTAARPLRPAQTLFRQKAAFLFMDKPARKSAKRTAFAKGQVGRGGAGTPPSRACADRRRPERRLFCGRRRARPPQPVLSFLREKSARAVLSFAGHLMRNQKRRRTDGAAAPQDGKAPAKTRRGRSGRPSGTASAGRTRRTAEIAASGGFSPRSRANRTRCRAARRTGKTDVFRPLAACPRRRILQTPARARFYPPSAKGESQRRQSPRRPPRRPEARPPKRARGAKSRARPGLPTGREPPPLPPTCGRTACFTAIAKDVFRPCFSLF